jgi:hypothetical protein
MIKVFGSAGEPANVLDDEVDGFSAAVADAWCRSGPGSEPFQTRRVRPTPATSGAQLVMIDQVGHITAPASFPIIPPAVLSHVGAMILEKVLRPLASMTCGSRIR